MTYRISAWRTTCFIFLLAFSLQSYAWNTLGHMVVANIAYKNLNKNARDQVDSLISYFRNEYPTMGSFMQLATWPDAIRSQRIGTFVHWHYIDNPFSFDGTPLKNTIDTDNAVWAFKNIGNVVKYQHANAYERVRFLAFLVHIVSDLHQPLHTVTYIAAHHPNGDRGGNQYYVRYQNHREKLHHLWDTGVGIFADTPTPENADALTENILALYPKRSLDKEVNDLDPEIWTKEGMENAKLVAYRTPENELVSDEYIARGRNLSKQQIALAGYRIAAILNSLFS